MSESTATTEATEDVTEGDPVEDQDATDDADNIEGSDEGEGDESDDDGADSLSDKGKQALDRMKSKWRTERDARREAERKLTEASSNDEADAEQRKRDSEALAKANKRILRSEIKAAAKGVLADPSDAFQFLDVSDFEVDDDGNVDEDEIGDAIKDLVTKKPYLAAQGGKRFQGGSDGGARKESRPRQYTQSDLDQMTPAQIVKARKEGRLSDLLGTST